MSTTLPRSPWAARTSPPPRLRVSEMKPWCCALATLARLHAPGVLRSMISGSPSHFSALQTRRSTRLPVNTIPSSKHHAMARPAKFWQRGWHAKSPALHGSHSLRREVRLGPAIPSSTGAPSRSRLDCRCRASGAMEKTRIAPLKARWVLPRVRVNRLRGVGQNSTTTRMMGNRHTYSSPPFQAGNGSRIVACGLHGESRTVTDSRAVRSASSAG
ncbi:hypothetical protein SAMN06296378_1791 [Salinibacterium xinjiangense]|uniref:Uncharacterized protein n=1 Tax=Salinibacterium xinjiangense TaxID=386302 RepID=A0A2C8ZNL4_9MICO|nr:hypothetical protein SAMN06296378_1791 [Salinibacterium xinjiangense]